MNELSVKHRNIFQRIYDEIKYLCKLATAESVEARELEKAKKLFAKVYRADTLSNTDSGTKYHISETFSSEIDKVLNNELDKSSQVKARDFTPEILVKNGVRDLPMLITQNHIKSIIYTEAQAKELGLPIGKNINYHGLGKELLLQSIDNMDDPYSIYRKDADHYLIITQLKNADGNNIVVPVKVDGKGRYNNVFIVENQILSTYGKKNLESYLERNDFECVYTKKGTALNEEVQYLNISNSFYNNVSQPAENVNSKSKNSLSENTQTQKRYGNYNVRGKDVTSSVSFADTFPIGEGKGLPTACGC